MPHLIAARAQMGTSLLFHIIFSVLGVGLPLLLCIAEGIGIRKKDPVWVALARRWSHAAAIIFAIGAVSGTIVEFELGLLWPTYINYTGAIIGPLFAFEGFAFFLEAIFFAIYLYGWDRLKPFQHWLCSFPIVIGGAASTWFIVTTNSWMNTPTGFTFKDGRLISIDTISAIFNPSVPYETVHMLLGCYVACGFGIAGLYAFSMLRGKRDTYRRYGLILGLAMALISTPLQIVSGDFNARYLAAKQPTKLAAMEGVFQTGTNVPLHIGGLPIYDAQTGKGTYYFSIDIPSGLSLMVGLNPNTQIRGLNEVPPEDRPNPLPIHLAFDGMVGSGFYAFGIAGLFWLLYFMRKRRIPEQALMLWGIVLAGVLSFVAVELGWIVTEEGRQPWAIFGFLRTAQAVTAAPFLNISFIIFALIYVILASTMIILLLRQARKPLPKMEWDAVASGHAESDEVSSQQEQTVGV